MSIAICGCLGTPEGVRPVDNFDTQKYLGTWYEIARLDHSFERGLQKVTAQYTLRDDGGIKVINKGFSVAENNWKEAEGKAYFVDDNNIGHLKVSFFGPFYSSYVVFELDKKHYQYAFISSYNLSYLWLLSRTATVDQSLVDRFLSTAKSLGFDTGDIIIVKQD